MFLTAHQLPWQRRFRHFTVTHNMRCQPFSEKNDANGEDAASVMDFTGDGEDNGTDIECQCCFADYTIIVH